jgi:hypothetical protein
VVTASYALTYNGTAKSYDVIAPANATVTFADGATTADAVVYVGGNVGYEVDKTFGITLSAPTGGATIAQATATGTILNDDPFRRRARSPSPMPRSSRATAASSRWLSC